MWSDQCNVRGCKLLIRFSSFQSKLFRFYIYCILENIISFNQGGQMSWMFSWTMGLATLFTLHIQSLRKNFNVMNKRSQEFFRLFQNISLCTVSCNIMTPMKGHLVEGNRFFLILVQGKQPSKKYVLVLV